MWLRDTTFKDLNNYLRIMLKFLIVFIHILLALSMPLEAFLKSKHIVNAAIAM